MIGVLKSDPIGFESYYKISLIVHGVFFAIVLIGFTIDKQRVFVSPMYATVDLISEKKTPTKTKTVKKQITKKKVVKKTKTKAQPKVVTPPAPESYDDILKEIESDVSDDDILTSRVDKIKKEEAKEQAEIDKDLKSLMDDLSAEYDEELSKETLTTEASGGQSGSKSNVIDSPYFNRLSEKVRSLWVYTGDKKDIETIVSLKISQSGRLIDLWIDESSGDSGYDESVLKAIKKAAPFAPLPEEITVPIYEFGFRFCGEKGCR